jgi:hypothetical protein
VSEHLNICQYCDDEILSSEREVMVNNLPAHCGCAVDAGDLEADPENEEDGDDYTEDEIADLLPPKSRRPVYDDED